MNAEVSVTYGDFSNVLVTKEWTPREPGSNENTPPQGSDSSPWKNSTARGPIESN
ncbi:MAG TPA: hypothetical protein VLE54_03610 [Thermoanaerobaculia bacterium]|nr:hypothetical protein [Thermoanaerobaculia bacterium]